MCFILKGKPKEFQGEWEHEWEQVLEIYGDEQSQEVIYDKC